MLSEPLHLLFCMANERYVNASAYNNLTGVYFSFDCFSLFAEIDYDAEHAEERLIATKRRKLQAIEKSNQASSDQSSQESGLYDSYTFVEKLTAQIIKNVQVRLLYCNFWLAQDKRS